jgi:hypothetical protein
MPVATSSVYGIVPGTLYQNYEVRGQKEITIHGLNLEAAYYFTVDAFNDGSRCGPQKRNSSLRSLLHQAIFMV